MQMQVPIFPIPVQSNESYLLYSLCLNALETGIYVDLPAILPYLQEMKIGLEKSYVKLAIPMFEYMKFVVPKKKEEEKVVDQKEKEDNVRIEEQKG